MNRPTAYQRQLADAIAARNARTVSRCDAAASFVAAIAIGAGLAAALLSYFEPCQLLHLCAGPAAVNGSTWLRSVRAGEPAPEPLPPPWFTKAIDAAREAGQADGERHGYVTGWRWGVVCGATAGILVGALLMVGATALGIASGVAP